MSYTVNFPCRVGDKVKLKVTCECIITDYDWTTGTSECPFEDECPFEECDNNNEFEVITTITEIFTRGTAWYMSLKNIDIDIPVNDIGRHVFIVSGSSDTGEPEGEAAAEEAV